MGKSHVIDIWGETTADDGATSAEAIFFPGAGRDPLSDELMAVRGHLLAVAGGAAGRAAARAFIAALVPAYYAGGGGAGGLRRGGGDPRGPRGGPAGRGLGGPGPRAPAPFFGPAPLHILDCPRRE